MLHPFCASINEHLNTIAERLIICLDAVYDENLWTDFAPNLSSPGNLVLHLIGNLNQYVIKGLGGKNFFRNRAKEFSDKPGLNKDQLKKMFTTTIRECRAVVASLSDEQLSWVYKVQGFEHSGYGILIHVTEHLSHHTGQFTWFCKYLFGSDTDFYKGRDLNVQ